MIHYRRALETTLPDDLAIYPVLALVGARQVGKSTLARQIADARGMAYLTLDDHELLAEARSEPARLLGRADHGGLCIDEAQRAPELFLAVKQLVDVDQRPGRVILTGSNQPALGASVGDSLLGRAAYRTLRPLSQSEIRLSELHDGWSTLFDEPDTEALLTLLQERAALNATTDWRETVRVGGYPRALHVPPEAAGRVLDDYIETFVRRDVRDVLNIESPERFEAFLRLAYARTGQELKYAGMSRDLGTPVNTLRKWGDALTRSYMVELVPAYTKNAGERVIKSPKLYAVDVGLAIAGARETDPTGFHLETLIASDLLRWRDAAAGRLVSHWRLETGQEVDFIVQQHARRIAVEVKATSAVSNDDARHLRTFIDRNGADVRAIVLSTDPEVRTLSRGVIAAPWYSVV